MFCNALGEPVRAMYATHPTSWARPFHDTKALGVRFNKYFGPSLELIMIITRRLFSIGELSVKAPCLWACFQPVSHLSLVSAKQGNFIKSQCEMLKLKHLMHNVSRLIALVV
jgi:hypothetical protein